MCTHAAINCLRYLTKSQQVFSDAIKELKAEGKADVDSYPEIEEQGDVFFL